MIIDESTVIITVDLDQYAIIDESSMIIDDFRKFSKCICRRPQCQKFVKKWHQAVRLSFSAQNQLLMYQINI